MALAAESPKIQHPRAAAWWNPRAAAAREASSPHGMGSWSSDLMNGMNGMIGMIESYMIYDD
jgi:hypothetical protein